MAAAAAFLSAAPASADGALTITPPHARFDDTYQAGSLEQVFEVENHGSTPVHVKRVEARTGNGKVLAFPDHLAPGEHGRIRVQIPLDSNLGESSFRFAAFTDEADVDRYRFTVEGFVEAAFEPAAPRLDFGTVARGTTPSSEVALDTREIAQWQFGEVLEKPDYLDVKVEGHRIAAQLRADAPPGWLRGRVLLRSGLARQPTVSIATLAFVVGELVPEFRAVDFGRVDLGADVRRDVVVRGRDGLAIRDTLTATAKAPWHASVHDCTPQASADCAKVELRGKPTQGGPLGGVVHLERKGAQEPGFDLPFFGLALVPGHPLHEIHADGAKAGTQGDVAATPTLASALAAVRRGASADGEAEGAQPGDPPAAAATPSPGPKAESRSATGAGPAHLHWNAGNDRSIYGYLVYRAEDRAGPYTRISTRIIPAQNDGAANHRYDFEDATVEKGRTYYYYVDTIDKHSRRERFVPVLEKTIQ